MSDKNLVELDKLIAERAASEPEKCGEVVGKTTQIKHMFCTKEKGHDGSCAALAPTEPVESEPVAWEYRTRMNCERWCDWRGCEKSTYNRCVDRGLPTEQVRKLYTHPVEPNGAREALEEIDDREVWEHVWTDAEGETQAECRYCCASIPAGEEHDSACPVFISRAAQDQK